MEGEKNQDDRRNHQDSDSSDYEDFFKPHIISVVDIFQYSKDDLEILDEGETIFQSNLVMCGKVAAEEGTRKYFGLCLQSEDGMALIHQIVIEILGKKINSQCSCTEKVMSGKCKHVVAVLMCLNSTTDEKIEDFTTRDIQKEWEELKKSKDIFKAVPIKEMCQNCFPKEKYKAVELTEDQREKIRTIFAEFNPLLKVNIDE